MREAAEQQQYSGTACGTVTLEVMEVEGGSRLCSIS